MVEALAVLDHSEIDPIYSELRADGIRWVMGSLVNAAGLTFAKCVPLARLETFHSSGMGAAPTWQLFAIDGEIAFTENITAVGDMRLRLDITQLRNLGDGTAWAPVNMFSQNGVPSPACPRALLADADRRMREAGYTARFGHELEFVLVNSDGTRLPEHAWIPYGASSIADHRAFLDDVLLNLEAAGVRPEQFHAEAGPNQFEVSLPPAPPVDAADAAALTKLVISKAARTLGLRASFSPIPFHGVVGNGAHQHFSLQKNGEPILSGGDGTHGLTPIGGSAIGGILTGLPELQCILTGSILSGDRLASGLWSGVFCCWGLENREASVRYIAGNPSNPYGANVEVKCIDPSANGYLGGAVILALALHGIENRMPLPPEIVSDPSKLSDEQRRASNIRMLSNSQRQMIDQLDRSTLARQLLGDEIVDITIAVRRHEHTKLADVEPETLTERFRLAWSM